MATPSSAPTPEKQALYEALVDTITAIFHSQPQNGYRPVHAKGIMCEGVFTPTPQAAKLSRAAHFSAPTAAHVRLSDSAGLPTIPDTDPMANPRGLGLKFQLPGGTVTDIVAHSVNGFPVSTAEEFLEFLQAIIASPPDAPHPNAIEKFVSVRPGAIAFVTATSTTPPPASFAHETFFSVNAVRFLSANGATRFGRYQVRPALGQKLVAQEAVSKLAPDFLFTDLRERLAKGPVEYQLVVQLANEADPTNDATKPWPEDREVVEIGTLRVDRPLADSDRVQRQMIFDPMNLADGIEPSDDPIPPARSAIYGISFARRNAH